MLKPHIQLNTKSQSEKPIKLKFNYGAPDEDYVNPNPDYRAMARRLDGDFRSYLRDRQQRRDERSHDVFDGPHVDYIRIQFFSQFDVSKYLVQWYKEFGVWGVRFSNFNNEILFAVVDEIKFNSFLKGIENFVEVESREGGGGEYPAKIKYIRDFQLLKTQEIIGDAVGKELVNLCLPDLRLDRKAYEIILSGLVEYLDHHGIGYSLDEELQGLEVYNGTKEQLFEIVQNFDIVLSITSSLATVIGPNELGLPERSYGFEVENVQEELPIVGIVDTGISAETPLSTILIRDEEFNLTGSGVFVDTVGRGAGHGTAVAALAALGKKPYGQGYRGSIKPDARLLSIKILDDRQGYISQQAVLDVLKRAKAKYPQLKVFVLTICYDQFKLDNEGYSSYAYELDKFAYDHDSIIVISTANNDRAALNNNAYNLGHFFSESANLCSPAESMNNITVGAAAHCLKEGRFTGISISKEFPTLYSRKGHINFLSIPSGSKKNKFYFKPDLIECGGDLEFNERLQGIDLGDIASMEVLSANPRESFYNHVGTSYSAPLVANIAAQIQGKYPNIRSQSIKAMIVNGASLDLIRFGKAHEVLLNRTAGHGLANETDSVYSNENSVTFLLEDEIEPEQLRVFPLNFPKYLSKEDLKKKRGVAIVTATLCYNFEPLLNHQLAYCPVSIAFSFFRNHSGEQIQKTEKVIRSLIKENLRWSQSARHVSRPVPYCNTHKLEFSVNVDELVDENSTFKLAVNCRVCPQILDDEKRRYQKLHPFSIVVNIREGLKASKLTGKLYDEMIACNEIINIVNLDADADQDADAVIE